MAKKKNTMATQVYQGLKTTSSGNIYIHFDPRDDGVDKEAFNRFTDEKIKQLIKPQLKKIKDVTNKYKPPSNFKDVVTFLDQVKGDYQEALTQSKIEENVITTGRRSVFTKGQENQISKEVETSFANLMSFPRKGSSVNVFDLFKKSLNEAGEVVDNFSNYMQFIDEIIKNTNTEFNDEKIDNFIKVYLERTKDTALAKGGKGASGGDFSKCFTEYFNKHDKDFIKIEGKNEYREAEETFEKYAVRLRTFQRLNEKLYKSLGESAPRNIKDYNERLMQGVAIVAGKTINSLGGYLYEPIVRDMSETAANGFMKMIRASVAGSNQVKIEGPDLQKKMGMKYTKSKPDVLLSYVEGEGASVSVLVPGVSVKAFTPKKGDAHQNIKIRSGATIREIYGLSLARRKEEQYLLANVFMYGAEGQLISGVQSRANRYLGSAHAVYALSGTLQKEDTAYFMILNGTILTVPEILKQVLNGKSTIESSFQKKVTDLRKINKRVTQGKGETIQEAAERRSENALIAYMAAKTNINLSLDSNSLVSGI